MDSEDGHFAKDGQKARNQGVRHRRESNVFETPEPMAIFFIAIVSPTVIQEHKLYITSTRKD